MQSTVDEGPRNSFKFEKWRQVGVRLLVFVLLAALIGWALKHLSNSFDQSPHPAGFGRGMLQGALMPMAMPNLLVGKDLTIYAVRNTGLGYKLGYTMGVNLCGALFFGVFFFRISRWRRRRKSES